MEPGNDLNLNEVLTILENPFRRQIIKRLSQEPNYSFQLAKETDLSQQQIANHLKIMEKAGIVTSSTETSSNGPKRQIYQPRKSFTITLNVAPHLYDKKLAAFVTPEKTSISPESLDFMDRVIEVTEYPVTETE